jgi:hypothetical protein
MKKFFARVQMNLVNNQEVHWLDFETMKSLPGWAAAANADEKAKAENILKALDIEQIVKEQAKLDEWVH